MSGVKMIRVVSCPGPNPHNVVYLNPAFISRITERHGESGLSGVDITAAGEHGSLSLTEEEWRRCTLVDLEETLPCPQGEPGQPMVRVTVFDAPYLHNLVHNAYDSHDEVATGLAGQVADEIIDHGRYSDGDRLSPEHERLVNDLIAAIPADTGEP